WHPVSAASRPRKRTPSKAQRLLLGLDRRAEGDVVAVRHVVEGLLRRPRPGAAGDGLAVEGRGVEPVLRRAAALGHLEAAVLDLVVDDLLVGVDRLLDAVELPRLDEVGATELVVHRRRRHRGVAQDGQDVLYPRLES